MGVPSRTAGQAYREINRYGRLRPDPEFRAAQKALEAAADAPQAGESELIKTIRKLVNPPKRKRD